MNSKKHFLLVSVAMLSMALGACNGSNKESKSSSPSTSISTSESESTSSETISSDESSSEEAPTVSNISIKPGTVKTDYIVGEDFTVEGGKLIVNFSDHTRREIDMTLSMIVNAPDMTVPHENYTVNVTYEGANTSYVINVLASDERIEVTIGVGYDYNGSETKDAVDNLEFVVGKTYNFYYGTNPSEAADAVSYKYTKLGENSVDLGTEKPTELGEYSYSVFIAEGDDTYKPVNVTYKFKIVEPDTVAFNLNKDNAPTLSETAGDLQAKVDDVLLNYKNAKAANDAVATLVKQADADAIAPSDDNYLEIASPTLLTSKLKVEFEGENNYIHVYGSYDLEHYFLLDTLTNSKLETERASDYFYFRLVATPLGHNELTIKKVEFSYEDEGAPTELVDRAEKSDRFNNVSSEEGNAYFHRRTAEVFDNNYSNKSIGIRLKECSVRVDFGTTIKAEEVKYYAVTFKAIPTSDAAFQNSKTDTTSSAYCPIYTKPVFGTGTLGNHLKLGQVNQGDTEWTTFSANLGDYFPDGAKDIDGLNVWLSRYCGSGAVVFDDFRLVQKTTYPIPYALDSIAVSGAKTEFNVGDTFTFDGVVTASYTDHSTKTISNDDPNLVITEPNLASSGTKTVTVTYTDGGVSKKTTYTINVTSANPKAEETYPIVDDANDLADAAYKFKTSHSYDCGNAINDGEVTYGASENSLKISGLTIDADTYITIKLPEAITKDSIHVKFFLKNSPCYLYMQLLSEDESQKAQRSETDVKNTVDTNPDATAHFVATEAGNDWMMYEYDFYAANVTNGVRYVRISTASKQSASDFFFIDGLEVK